MKNKKIIIIISIVAVIVTIMIAVGLVIILSKGEKNPNVEPTPIGDENNTNEVSKLDKEKEYVYTLDKVNENRGEQELYELNAEFPKINLTGKIAEEANEKLEQIRTKYMKGTSWKQNNQVVNINYFWNVNNNILSFALIEQITTQETNENRKSYYVYNINLDTGKNAKISELIKDSEIDIEDVEYAIRVDKVQDKIDIDDNVRLKLFYIDNIGQLHLVIRKFDDGNENKFEEEYKDLTQKARNEYIANIKSMEEVIVKQKNTYSFNDIDKHLTNPYEGEKEGILGKENSIIAKQLRIIGQIADENYICQITENSKSLNNDYYFIINEKEFKKLEKFRTEDENDKFINTNYIVTGSLNKILKENIKPSNTELDIKSKVDNKIEQGNSGIILTDCKIEVIPNNCDLFDYSDTNKELYYTLSDSANAIDEAYELVRRNSNFKELLTTVTFDVYEFTLKEKDNSYESLTFDYSTGSENKQRTFMLKDTQKNFKIENIEGNKHKGRTRFVIDLLPKDEYYIKELYELN